MAETLTERVTRFEAHNVPIGWVVTGTVGLGIGNALAGAVSGFTGIKPQWTKMGLGAAVAMIPWFRKTLGEETTNLLSALLIANGVNTAWGIQQRTEALMAGLLPERAPRRRGNPSPDGNPDESYDVATSDGNGYHIDAMDTLRLSLAGGG